MLAVLLVAPLGATFELSNAHLRLQVESSTKDAWFSFVGAPASGAPNLLSVVPQLTPLWEAQFATPAGLVQRTNSNATSVAAHATETSLTLEWSCSEPLDVAVPYIVRLAISLPKDARSDYLPGAGAVSLDLVSADGQRTRLGNFSGGTVRVDRTVAGRSVEMLEMSPL